MRGRAQVRVSIEVSHQGSHSILGTELAAVTVKDESILDRGAGELIDNEWAFTGLLERVTREAQAKIESTLSEQWSERTNEVEEERRDLQLSDADRFIADAPDEFERKRRREVVGAFLKHDFTPEGETSL